MFNFYKIIESVANSGGKQYDSIKDLTYELAMNAGYYRKMYTFNNGSVRERTFYTKEFDSILTAKWLMYYKHLFITKLVVHPELKDYHVYIITRTFMVAMASINLEKMIVDNDINKYVNMTLSSRFAEVLHNKGSINRLQYFIDTGDKSKLNVNNTVNNLSLSLDELKDNNIDFYYQAIDDVGTDDYFYVLDLEDKLKGTKFGKRLLKSMLNSNKKIQLNHIDDFMYMDKSEMVEDNKKDIAISYNIIKQYLKPNKKFRKVNYNKIKYSFESQGI